MNNWIDDFNKDPENIDKITPGFVLQFAVAVIVVAGFIIALINFLR